MKSSKKVFEELVAKIEPLKEDEKGKLRGGFQGISRVEEEASSCNIICIVNKCKDQSSTSPSN